MQLNRVLLREPKMDIEVKPGGVQKIGVLGVARGVGTTFMAVSIAYELAQKKEDSVGFVSASDYFEAKNYVEPRGCLYDSLGMEKRFALRGFSDVFGLLEEGKSIRKVQNVDDFINWALPMTSGSDGSSGTADAWDVVCRAINNLPCDVLVCDLGAFGDGKALEKILPEMDTVVIVVDPLPSKLIAGNDRLEMLKALEEGLEAPFVYVLNRMNRGVMRREALKFVGRRCVEVPALELEDIYAAEYNCKIPMSARDICAILADPLMLILGRV